MQEIDSFLFNISKSNIHTYLIGDFNINIAVNDDASSSFLNLFTAYNMHPLINKPTRVSNSHTSILDNVFTNNNDRMSLKGIICDEISDHLPIFTCIPIKSKIPVLKRPNLT